MGEGRTHPRRHAAPYEEPGVVSAIGWVIAPCPYASFPKPVALCRQATIDRWSSSGARGRVRRLWVSAVSETTRMDTRFVRVPAASALGLDASGYGWERRKGDRIAGRRSPCCHRSSASTSTRGV